MARATAPGKGPIREIRAVLRLSTKAELSRVLGLSTRRLNTFAKRGVPPDYLERVTIALKAAREREKQAKKLLRMSPEALAASSGVTLRTARNWIKKQSLPRVRATIELLESETREPAPRQFRFERREFVGRVSAQGAEYITRVDAYLDPALRRALLAKLSLLRDKVRHPRRTYHFVIVADAPEDYVLSARARSPGSPYTSYNVKFLEKPAGRLKRGDAEQLVISSFAHRSKAVALRDLGEQLTAADGQGLFLHTASMFVRKPLRDS